MCCVTGPVLDDCTRSSRRWPATVGRMDIVAAVFIENIELRPAPGPSTRIDLTGVHFSMAAPSPVPVTLEPHLVVLVRCRPDEAGHRRARDHLHARRRAGGPQRPAARRSSRASSTTGWCGPSSSSPSYGTSRPTCASTRPGHRRALHPAPPGRLAVRRHAVRRRAVRAPAAHPRHRRGGRLRCSSSSAPSPTSRWCSSPAPHRRRARGHRAAIRPPSNRGTLIGATAVSVLGGDREVEEQSAVSLFAAGSVR